MGRRRTINAASPSRLSGGAALLCLLAFACARAQESAARAPGPQDLFQEAKAVGDAARPDAFEFELDGYVYRVANNGAGRRVKGDRTRLFSLRLEGLSEIRRVEFMGHEGNVILVCELDYGDGRGVLIYRLEQPSMRALWSLDMPALDIKAVRDGGALYLSGNGFVGKLDLRTGLYAWKHEALAERGPRRIPLSRFARPEVGGEAAVFRALPDEPGRPARTFRVHKKSGKILGVE